MGSNEGRACHAVIKVLERELNSAHRDLSRPELNPSLPPVELIVTVAGSVFAIEHTLVEAFAGQIEAERISGELVGPIIQAFQVPLPIRGTIRLYFPADTRVGRSQLALVQHQVIDWVKDAALRLSIEIPEHNLNDQRPRAIVQKEEREFGGIRVLLRRHLYLKSAGTLDGEVVAARFASGDIEEQRRKRIGQALVKKLGKLHAWKDRGANTILIVESNDIALSNEIVISEALAHCLQDEVLELTPPDAIFLVDTCLHTWRVYTLKSAAKDWLHDRFDRDEVEFEKADLTDLTGR